MAHVSPHAPNNDFDDDLDDILKDVLNPTNVVQSTEKPPQPEPWRTKKSDAAGALGVDEEIIISKKRQPAPKLDDQRLLSDAGIPRLRKISKDRLRFKGKGHEYGDIARMLNMYQLWLDDLYPRAKFADALAIIEKVGHTKRMQMMRKDWLDEGKPRRTAEQDEDAEEAQPEKTPAQQSTAEMEGLEKNGDVSHSRATDEHQEPSRAPPDGTGDDPDDDELDALLAESEQPGTASKTLPSRTAPIENDPFADEMEAMEDMDGMWD